MSTAKGKKEFVRLLPTFVERRREEKEKKVNYVIIERFRQEGRRQVS